MICCWLNKVNSDVVVGLALGLVILKNPTSYIQFIQSKDTQMEIKHFNHNINTQPQSTCSLEFNYMINTYIVTKPCKNNNKRSLK